MKASLRLLPTPCCRLLPLLLSFLSFSGFAIAVHPPCCGNLNILSHPAMLLSRHGQSRPTMPVDSASACQRQCSSSHLTSPPHPRDVAFPLDSTCLHILARYTSAGAMRWALLLPTLQLLIIVSSRFMHSPFSWHRGWGTFSSCRFFAKATLILLLAFCPIGCLGGQNVIPPQPLPAACKRNSALAGTPLRHHLQWRPLVLGLQRILPGANKYDPQSFSPLMQSGAGGERRLLFGFPPHSDSHRRKRVEQPSGSGSIGKCESPVCSEHRLPVHLNCFLRMCDPAGPVNRFWARLSADSCAAHTVAFHSFAGLQLRVARKRWRHVLGLQFKLRPGKINSDCHIREWMFRVRPQPFLYFRVISSAVGTWRLFESQHPHCIDP